MHVQAHTHKQTEKFLWTILKWRLSNLPPKADSLQDRKLHRWLPFGILSAILAVFRCSALHSLMYLGDFQIFAGKVKSEWPCFAWHNMSSSMLSWMDAVILGNWGLGDWAAGFDRNSWRWFKIMSNDNAKDKDIQMIWKVFRDYCKSSILPLWHVLESSDRFFWFCVFTNDQQTCARNCGRSYCRTCRPRRVLMRSCRFQCLGCGCG